MLFRLSPFLSRVDLPTVSNKFKQTTYNRGNDKDQIKTDPTP